MSNNICEIYKGDFLNLKYNDIANLNFIKNNQIIKF